MRKIALCNLHFAHQWRLPGPKWHHFRHQRTLFSLANQFGYCLFRMRVLFDGPIVRETSVCAKLIAYARKLRLLEKMGLQNRNQHTRHTSTQLFGILSFFETVFFRGDKMDEIQFFCNFGCKLHEYGS